MNFCRTSRLHSRFGSLDSMTLNMMNFLSQLYERLCTGNQFLVRCFGEDSPVDSARYHALDDATIEPKEKATMEIFVNFLNSFSQIVASLEQVDWRQGLTGLDRGMQTLSCSSLVVPTGKRPTEQELSVKDLISELIHLRRTAFGEVEECLELCLRDDCRPLLKASLVTHAHRRRCDLYQQILDLKDRFYQAEADLLHSRQHCEEVTAALVLDKVLIGDLNQLNDQLLRRKTEMETKARKLEEQIVEMETKDLDQALRTGEPSVCPHIFYITVKKSYQLLKTLTREFMDALSEREHKVGSFSRNLCPAGVTLTKEAHFEFVVHSHLSDIIFSSFESEGFGYEISASVLDPNSYRATCFTEYQAMQVRISIEPDRPTCTKPFEIFYIEKLKGLHMLTETLQKMLRESLAKVEKDAGVNTSHSLGLQKVPWKLYAETSFLNCLQSVWLLHKLAFSFDPPARIFRVGLGADYDNSCMKDVVREDAGSTSSDWTSLSTKVGFMITPGFRVGKSKIFKSRVYLQEVQPTGSTHGDSEQHVMSDICLLTTL